MLGWRKTGVGKDLPSKKVGACWWVQDRLCVFTKGRLAMMVAELHPQMTLTSWHLKIGTPSLTQVCTFV